MSAKTPEEIKKGMECCYGNEEIRLCELCPFSVKTEGAYPSFECSNFDAVGEYALALIQQLEAERDQAVEDLRYIGKLRENNCTFCLYYNHGDGSKECIRCGMFGEDHWQWRGVPEREG